MAHPYRDLTQALRTRGVREQAVAPELNRVASLAAEQGQSPHDVIGDADPYAGRVTAGMRMSNGKRLLAILTSAAVVYLVGGYLLRLVTPFEARPTGVAFWGPPVGVIVIGLVGGFLLDRRLPLGFGQPTAATGQPARAARTETAASRVTTLLTIRTGRRGATLSLAAIAVALVLGGATSPLQGLDGFSYAANSVVGWTIPMLILTVAARGGVVRSALTGALVFVALCLGYSLVSTLRGYPDLETTWATIGVVAGLGLGACVGLVNRLAALVATRAPRLLGIVLVLVLTLATFGLELDALADDATVAGLLQRFGF